MLVGVTCIHFLSNWSLFERKDNLIVWRLIQRILPVLIPAVFMKKKDNVYMYNPLKWIICVQFTAWLAFVTRHHVTRMNYLAGSFWKCWDVSFIETISTILFMIACFKRFLVFWHLMMTSMWKRNYTEVHLHVVSLIHTKSLQHFGCRICRIIYT